MKQSIGLWQLMGFAVTSLGGTLLHFLYDWTGGALWIAPFSGVNESTWEHMKLLFFPMLLFALVQSHFLGREVPAFWYIKLKGTVLGLTMIPVLFYTLGGVFGTLPDWINIAIFFVADAIAYLYETKKFRSDSLSCRSQILSFAALCVIALLFAIFTFLPPMIPLFEDPLTGMYGIQ